MRFQRKSNVRSLAFVALTAIVLSFQNCADSFNAVKFVNGDLSSVFGGISSVNLVWDKVTENEDGTAASIRGYKLYVGTSSENYTTTIDDAKIGNLTDYRISGLVSGETYYFSVAAVSSDGSESGLSSEISYEVP